MSEESQIQIKMFIYIKFPHKAISNHLCGPLGNAMATNA